MIWMKVSDPDAAFDTGRPIVEGVIARVAVDFDALPEPTTETLGRMLCEGDSSIVGAPGTYASGIVLSIAVSTVESCTDGPFVGHYVQAKIRVDGSTYERMHGRRAWLVPLFSGRGILRGDRWDMFRFLRFELHVDERAPTIADKLREAEAELERHRKREARAADVQEASERTIADLRAENLRLATLLKVYRADAISELAETTKRVTE